MPYFSLLLLFVIGIGLAAAENLQPCGGAQYYPSQYTCYDGNFLCPKINGEPTLRCGDACYSPYMYSCSNKVLSLLPEDKGPFTLVADNPTQPFHGKTIEACGNLFWIGKGPCTFCPDAAKPSCPAGKITAVYEGSGMAVEVPGGQAYYIAPDGSLGYTAPHSASMPTGAVQGVSAYKNGMFKYLPGDGWYACPSGAGQWKIFQQLGGLNFGSCTGLNILVKDLPAGTTYGAWEYT